MSIGALFYWIAIKYIAVKKGYKVNYNKEKNCIELYKGDKLEKEISGYYVHNGTAIVTTELFRLKFNNNWNERYHEIFDLYDSVEDAALATGCICYKLGLNFKFGVRKNNDKYAIDLAPSESSILFKMNNNKIYRTDGKILYDMDKIFSAASAKDIHVKDPENDCITVDGWLNLYTNPTVNGVGRNVKVHPNAKKYDWGMPEELFKNVPSKGTLTKNSRESIQNSGGTPTVKFTNNNLYIDNEGRYWVAVAPKIMNPQYDGKHNINDNDMKYGTKIDIVVLDEKTNTKYYIPAVVGDAKEHSAPDGLYQTGIPFNPNRPTVKGDGSTIEFMGYNIVKNSVNKTNNYRLIEIIVYDGVFNY